MLTDLEKEEDELELRSVDVVALTTMFVAAKGAIRTILQRLSNLVQDRRNHYCWRKCLSLEMVPVHGECVHHESLIVQNWQHIKWKFVIEACHKQIQIGMNIWKIEFAID